MTKIEILNIIKENGFIWTNNFSSEETNVLFELVVENKISSLKAEGINFLNSSYCFIFPENPDGIFIKNEGHTSYVCKPH